MLRITGVQNELLDGFRLREVRIEPLTGSVDADGAKTHLSSKSMEVLLCLARNPRTLVSREAILEKVWGTGDVSNESLSRAISDIRHALRDHTDHPVFVQTVPKRGYRLLVEPQIVAQQLHQLNIVNDAERSTLIGNLMARGVIQASVAFLLVGWVLIQVADAVVPIVGLPGWTVPLVTYTVIGGFPVVVLFAWFFEYAEGRFYLDRGKRSPTVTTGIGKNYLTMVAAYVITALAALIYQFSVGFESPAGSTTASIEIVETDIKVEPNSIAVLRFMNIDGSETSEIFSHGFAEDVLDRLARVPGLLVSARGDSWSLPLNSSSDEVRRRLRVAYYLEGSVRLVDDELRVVAQLINSATGFHVVSRSFNRNLENFMDVQREIMELTVANLRVALPEDTQMLLSSTYPGTDVDAYVLYRRGKELFDAPQTEESLAQVVNLYQQALQTDPGYAAAHAGLCIAYANAYRITNNADYVDMAEKACARALSASANLNVVYTALGDLYLLNGRDADAETAYSRALDINSQDVQAMQGLAQAYARQQRTVEAEDLFHQAIRLQPGNWGSLDSLGGFLFVNGRYADAAEAYRKVVLLDPNNWRGHGNLGSSLLMSGDFELAATALRRAVEIQPVQDYYSNLAIIHYYLGQFDESVTIQRKAVELSAEANTSWLNLGDALLFSSQPDQAEAAFRISAELAKKNLAINPNDAPKLFELAWAETMLGNRDHASELINRSKVLDSENPFAHYYDALIKHHIGNDDAAIDALEIAVASGYPIVMLKSEPHLSGLRNRQDFQSLTSNQADSLN